MHSLRWLPVLLLSSFICASHAGYVEVRGHREALPSIALRELPPEAREMVALIRAGGPFHYDRDGVIFGNREGMLPPQSRGYYHEYTVRTPGERTRGARRIVCGDARTTPVACFYSDDHYQSFRRIQP